MNSCEITRCERRLRDVDLDHELVRDSEMRVSGFERLDVKFRSLRLSSRDVLGALKEAFYVMRHMLCEYFDDRYQLRGAVAGTE